MIFVQLCWCSHSFNDTSCFKCINLSIFWLDNGIALQSTREHKQVPNVVPQTAFSHLHSSVLYILLENLSVYLVFPVIFPRLTRPSSSLLSPCFTFLVL